MKCAFFLLNKQVNKQEALRYKLKQKNPYTYVKTSTCIQLIKEKEKKTYQKYMRQQQRKQSCIDTVIHNVTGTQDKRF